MTIYVKFNYVLIRLTDKLRQKITLKDYYMFLFLNGCVIIFNYLPILNSIRNCGLLCTMIE